VSLYLVRHQNIISRVLAIITAFFTNQIQENKIIYPPNPQADIDVETFPFKSKRFMTVFSDLRNLCHTEPVQQLIAHNREFITQFSRTCQLFMCVNPNKRAASTHVEYETDVWISVFNVTLSLSRVIKVYGEAFSRSTVVELVSAITTVMHHILMVSAVHDDDRDPTRFPRVAFHGVEFGDRTYDVVNFEVMEGWVSFHHSLQWLLAELFKHVDILDESSLQEVGLTNLREVCLRNASVQAIQTIVDYPLRGEPSVLPFRFRGS
jgi:E3 ubiquitin-protein ligase UBR1